MREFELVIPAYNEAKSLRALIERTVESAKETGFTPQTFQLVLVNNGSTDESQALIETLEKSDLGPWFRTVLVIPNEGYGNGISRGLAQTQATYVGWTHADMQCDPMNAFKAVKLLRGEKTPTLVKGVRHGRQFGDIFVSRVFELVARVLVGLKVYEINAQPKVFPSQLLAFAKNPPTTFAFDIYMLYAAAKHGYQTKAIEVYFPPRIHGTSKWAYNLMNRYKTIWGMIKYLWKLARTEGRL